MATVDKIVSDLSVFVDSSDLNCLRELWSYLEGKFFSRIPPSHNVVVKKYEFGLYKFYLVEALRANRKEKVNEFFDKMSSELNPFPEWKEWYLLTHVKNLEDHSPFSMYGNRSYREAFFVSIRNFLNVIHHRTWTVAEVCPKNQYAVEIMDDFFSIAQPKIHKAKSVDKAMIEYSRHHKIHIASLNPQKATEHLRKCTKCG